MCIIAAKPAGIGMPSRETIRTMWNGNRDGAGIMYVENGKVVIEKGFMKLKDFESLLDRLGSRLDLKATPVVMHFRITTHGGTKPENTHPFPITDSMGALKKLTFRTDVGVAHNGIINSVTPGKGISDTMEYIVSQLAPLKRALPRFYENRDAMLLVKNAISSRMAFLTKEGNIYTIGDFIEDEGILYSNYSFQSYASKWRSLDWSKYGYWYDDEDDEYAEQNYLADAMETAGADDVKALMWLDDGDYIITEDGDFHEGAEGLLIDSDNNVWLYEPDLDLAEKVSNAIAYTSTGLPLTYDPSSEWMDTVPVSYSSEIISL